MTETFEHISVLQNEITHFFVEYAPKVVVDCTLGGAGHTQKILENLPNCHLIGIDQDPTAIEVAKQRLAAFESRVQLVHGSFINIKEHLQALGIEKVDGILADLGVSSHQLDTPNRGFSFRENGPLDMRMDPTQGHPATWYLENLSAEDLANGIWEFGEERYSRKIARALIQDQPQTTLEAAQLIARIIPRTKKGIHPATRTFQGLRIMVNRELDALQSLLNDLPDILNPGGLAAMISFHSLEDRLVKRAFKPLPKDDGNPFMNPIQEPHQFKILTKKPMVANSKETSTNIRSRSAKLRVALRTDA